MKKSTIFWHTVVILFCLYQVKDNLVEAFQLIPTVLSCLVAFIYTLMNLAVLVCWTKPLEYNYDEGKRYCIVYWLIVFPVTKLNKFLDNL